VSSGHWMVPRAQGPLLQGLWDMLHNVTNRLWLGETRELTATVVREVPPSGQCEYLGHAAADAFAALQLRFRDPGAAGLKSQA
jgi:hypothetical protein